MKDPWPADRDREAILAGIGAALRPRGKPPAGAGYEVRPGRREVKEETPPAPAPETIARFVAEARAAGAEVHEGEAGEVMERLFGREIAASALSPDREIDRTRGEYPLGVTRAAWAIAATGTVVEYHPAGSERAASALPDTHVAVVPAGRILPDLAAFYARFREELGRTSGGHYAVFVTGPSRTADIEQTLVLGAHGPRRLVIVLSP